MPRSIMRRWILLTVAIPAAALALAVGPFGVAATPPWVYGCTPAMMFNNNTAYADLLSIYNGSPSTANLTLKVLAGNGTILNGPLTVPVNPTVPATHTAPFFFLSPGTNPSESNGTDAASVRIVSNVPVSATLSHALTGFDWKMVSCTPQQP